MTWKSTPRVPDLAELRFHRILHPGQVHVFFKYHRYKYNINTLYSFPRIGCLNNLVVHVVVYQCLSYNQILDTPEAWISVS